MRFKCKLYRKRLFWIQVPETNRKLFCVLFLNDRITFQHMFFFFFLFCEIKTFTFVYVWLFQSCSGPVMMRAPLLFRLLIIWNRAARLIPRQGRQVSTPTVLVWLRLPVLDSTTSWREDGRLPVSQRSLSSGVCGVWKTKAGDPLQLEDVNHKEAFLKHNGFSFLSHTKAVFFF